MAMTLPEAAMYFKYAEKHPPVSYMVAAYLGVKPPTSPRRAPSKESEMDDLLRMFGGPGQIRPGAIG